MSAKVALSTDPNGVVHISGGELTEDICAVYHFKCKGGDWLQRPSRHLDGAVTCFWCLTGKVRR